MRALFEDYGFTISIFIAVLITAIFAFVFGADTQLVSAMLILGVYSALIEYFLRSKTGLGK
jgi:hypothetical protein